VTVEDLAALPAFKDACPVKIDIEGGEQVVCESLLKVCHARSIPLLMSFHLSWWRPDGVQFQDFAALAGRLYPHVSLDEVRRNPFASVLFV
jgi:hypothetical protein